MSCASAHENVVFLKDALAVRIAFLSLYALLLFWRPRKIVEVICPMWRLYPKDLETPGLQARDF